MRNKRVPAVLAAGFFIAVVLAPASAFRDYSEPFFTLDYPVSMSAVVGSEYLGRGKWSAAPPVSVETVGSLGVDQRLDQVSGNAGFGLNVLNIFNLGAHYNQQGFTAECYGGLKLIRATQAIPLGDRNETIVDSALFVDSLIVATKDGRAAGGSFQASVDNFQHILKSVGSLFGTLSPEAPVAPVAPAPSLNCANLAQDALSDLQGAGPTPPPVRTPSPSPTPSPAASGSPNPGASPSASPGASPSGAPAPGASPKPSPGLDANSIQLPTAAPSATPRGVSLSVDASRSRARVAFQSGSALIVGVSLFDVVPMTATKVDGALTFSNADNNSDTNMHQFDTNYDLAFAPSANANRNAICVLATFLDTNQNKNDNFVFCPARSQIAFRSNAALPSGYTAPPQYSNTLRVAIQSDDVLRNSLTFTRTQERVDLRGLKFVFDQMAAPNPVQVTGKVTVRREDYRITPVTRAR